MISKNCACAQPNLFIKRNQISFSKIAKKRKRKQKHTLLCSCFLCFTLNYCLKRKRKLLYRKNGAKQHEKRRNVYLQHTLNLTHDDSQFFNCLHKSEVQYNQLAADHRRVIFMYQELTHRCSSARFYFCILAAQ